MHSRIRLPDVLRVLVFLVLLVMAGARTATSAVLFTIQDLGAFSTSVSANTVGTALNDSGQVVGHSYLDGVGDRAFLFSAGVLHNLGTFPATGYTESYPLAINNAGSIVGYAYKPAGSLFEAFLSTGTSLTSLWLAGPYLAAAMGINDAGQILALSEPSAGYYTLVVGSGSSWPAVRMVTGMGNLVLNQEWPAEYINRAGVIVGSEVNPTLGSETGAIWYGTASNTAVLDVGLPPGEASSHLMKINNVGQAVGYSNDDAVSYTNGVLQALPTLGGSQAAALGINDSGQVVGWANTTGNSAIHAFLYQHSAIQDLNGLVSPDSGWVLTSAPAINARGQILANGTHRGQVRAALLTPTASLASVQPTAETGVEMIRVVPSPEMGGAAFEFARPATRPSRLRILDVQGRLVRTLDVRQGATAVSWNDTDSEGARVANGVYVLRANLDGHDYTGRVVVLH